MATKRTFASIDEELELMEKWFDESEYYKTIKQIKEIGKNEFPAWNTEYGFKTNDLDCLIAEYDSGFNGREKPLVNTLLSFLGNYDMILVKNGIVNVGQSNNPEMAKLIIKLQNVAQ